MDKVSVIIPIYNSEQYLKRCIESVLAQTYSNIEIVLVEDCSNDNSLEICKSYKANNDNIVLLHHQTNQGQTKTRNEGLKNVTGKWVTFLDSDDAMEPDAIECFVKYSLQFPADFLFCGYKTILQNGTKEFHKSELADGVYTRKEIAKELYTKIPLDVLSCIGAKFYLVDFLTKRKEETPESIKTNYDMAFVVDALNAAEKIAYVNWCGYSYYIRSGSITYSYRNSMYKSLTSARVKLKSLFLNEGLYSEKLLDYQKMRWGIITGVLSQEVLFGRGFDGFKVAFREIVNDMDNKETFSVILKKDRVLRHKVLALLLMHRMLCITYFLTNITLRGKMKCTDL